MEIIVPMELDQEKSRQDFLHGKLKLLVYQRWARTKEGGRAAESLSLPYYNSYSITNYC